MPPLRLFRTLLLLLPLLTCLPRAAASAPDVVVSIKPLHSLVAGVMQGVAEPALLISGNQSPHTFTLAPSDVRLIKGAELIVWVGETLEAPLAKTIAANSKGAQVIEFMTMQGLARAGLREGGAWEAHSHDHGQMHEKQHEHHGHAREDVHLWLSPLNAGRLVDAVAMTLAGIDPENAKTYRVNAAALHERITRLDAELRSQLLTIRDTPYIVFHDAYQLFEKHYGLNTVGSVVISPGRMPGARRVHEMRERLVQSGAKCIFSEPQFDPGLIATIIEGTDVRTGTLDPVGVDLEPGNDAWFELMQNLANALVECLGD
ncbi:MAG: zinc ABC transporter substrate-binding protein [Gammaproteobacteria bacterium]|jgi:zinc transport system substrate-binding protein